MNMKKLLSKAKSRIVFLLTLFAFTHSYGQTLKEQLIINDTPDSTLLNAESVNFDINGNFLFQIEKDKESFFIDKLGKIGPLKSNFLSTIDQYSKTDDENTMYYKCASVKLIGPITGKDISDGRYPVSKTLHHLAVPIFIKDSIYIYFDGKLIKRIDTLTTNKITNGTREEGQLEAKSSNFESADWMNISNNGNYIYSVENNLIYSLIVNGKQVDSSLSKFDEIKINNNGDYIYAKGRKPLPNEDKNYSYMFFVHSKDTVLGPVRTVWESKLTENGAYFYSGDDNGPDYIIIDNDLYKNIDSISNITLVNKKNYLFTYRKNGKTLIVVNGKNYSCSYKEILFPTLDTLGNFAFYGLRNYYLYKYINGVEDPNPITKYNVRPIPLRISSTGKSLHYFKTDDSTYIYKENKLLFPAFNNTKDFVVKQVSEIISDNNEEANKDDINNGNKLLYVEIDSVGYIVYNGEFSKPMIAVKEHSYLHKKNVGEIIDYKMNDKGFFVIQKTAEQSFMINLNNQVYKEVTGINEIFKNSCYFDGKQLVFYGIKGLSFYQYTLSL